MFTPMFFLDIYVLCCCCTAPLSFIKWHHVSVDDDDDDYDDYDDYGYDWLWLWLLIQHILALDKM